MNTSSKQIQNNPLPTRFISAYSPKLKISLTFPAQGRTKQSFKSECDINTIMARYQSTGILPDMLNQQNGQYLDVTEMDYQSSMELVAGARSLFNELPSKIRSRFENDPAKFLAFTSDEKNRPEMAELGLLSAEALSRMAEAAAQAAKAPEAPKTAPVA